MLDNVAAVEPEDAFVTSNVLSGWTEARVATMTLLWIDGLSCSEIAGRLGNVTRNGVIGKVNRLGLNISHPRKPSVHPQATFLTSEEKARRLAERQEKRREQARLYWRSRPPRPSRARPAAPPPPVEILPPPDFLALTFNDLERDMCRYPRGEGAEMRFCGQPVKPEHSWCEHCCTIVYRPLVPGKRAPFIQRARA